MKHGGDLTEAMARYGGSPQMWLDLSTGVNPWPWPIPDWPGALWQRLPSRADEEALIVAAREAYAVPAGAEIVLAPGTQSLIQWLPQLAGAGAVAIVEPTYTEHALAWRMAEGDNAVQAMRWANVAAGLAVQTFGTAVLTHDELVDAFDASR